MAFSQQPIIWRTPQLAETVNGPSPHLSWKRRQFIVSMYSRRSTSDVACLIASMTRPCGSTAVERLLKSISFIFTTPWDSRNPTSSCRRRTAPPIKTETGHIGMMICYDLRFPELSRLLALMGAEILVCPSGWVQGDMKVEHWQTMVRARALENGCYMIAPGHVGII